MVSQPEPLDQSLAVHRPPSLWSRPTTTTTRRQRQNRSHHGGGGSSSSTIRSANEFPIFSQTGDVEIIVRAGGREQRYLLHRLILAQCSAFFQAGTSQEGSWSGSPSNGRPLTVVGEDEDATPLSSSGRRMGERQRRWRYELDEGNEVPMLVQKNPSAMMFGEDGHGQNPSRWSGQSPPPPSTRNKPTAPQAGFFRTMASRSAMHLPASSRQVIEPEKERLRDYDNLFRTFYNYPPTLDALDIVQAYAQCKGLLNLADMYDALDVVGPRVDHHLLQFQGRLWKQIAKYPPSYLKVGYLARSKVIFAEALVHVVGQWPAGSALVRAQLPEPVLDVIQDKVEEVEDRKMVIEGRLFRLTLITSRGERVTPANAYLAWTAVSLFRQWLAEHLTPVTPSSLSSSSSSSSTNHPETSSQHRSKDGPNPPRLPPNRSSARPPAQPPAIVTPATSSPIDAGRTFRLIGAGGQAYLNRDELKRFLKLRPEEYSRDTLRRFEQRIEEIKALAKDIVRPLMRHHLALDLGKDGAGGGSLGYLTCTKVDERDFPWEETER